MLNSKFSMLINDMQQFVNKSIEIREKISKLQNEGSAIYSHSKIENDCNSLNLQLQEFAEKKLTAGKEIIKAITEELQSTSAELNLTELQPLFNYFSAAGEKCTVEITENQIIRFAGNAAAIKALEQAAENNNCPLGVIQIIKNYYLSAETVENSLMKELVTVYTAGGSATDAGRHVADIAKHCGAVVTSDIVDTYHDNLLLRKAFGLI